MDYVEDYNLIKIIINNLYPVDQHFSYRKIENFLGKNKNLLKINKKHLDLQTKKFHKKRNTFFKIKKKFINKKYN